MRMRDLGGEARARRDGGLPGMKPSETWSPTTSLNDYRRRARTRNTLANFTLCGLGLAFVGLFVAVAAGITGLLQWIFAWIEAARAKLQQLHPRSMPILTH